MEGILAIIFLFGGGTLALLSMSPVGRAVADRIRAGAHGMGPDPELLGEVESLRQEVAELAERVDFAERMLARKDGAEQLGGGQG